MVATSYEQESKVDKLVREIEQLSVEERGAQVYRNLSASVANQEVKVGLAKGVQKISDGSNYLELCQ